jgi:hypothetical protein
MTVRTLVALFRDMFRVFQSDEEKRRVEMFRWCSDRIELAKKTAVAIETTRTVFGLLLLKMSRTQAA